jgi:hypothetical protein
MQFGRGTAKVWRNDYFHIYSDISLNLFGYSETLLLPLKIYDLVHQKCAIVLMEGTARKNIDSLIDHFICVSKE